MDFFEMFSKGGFVMYLLLLISIFVAAISIERFKFYRYAMNDSENFLKELVNRAEIQSIDEILNFCRSKNGSVIKVALNGLEAVAARKNVELALNVSYEEEAMKLRSKLNYLSMIVTLAPLLGLLGTIFGMIKSFNIFSVQAGQPLAITGGIGEALIATATGLCVAIFSLTAHTFLAQKLDEILSKLDKVSAIVLSIAEEKGENYETP